MRWLRLASVLWATAAPGAETYTYWIQPCAQEVAAHSACDAEDPELARWALDAWQQAAGRGLRFIPANGENDARIRLYWLGERPQLYGETMPLLVNGKRGAAIEVHPDLSQLGPRIAAVGQNDRLFRDTVVYLTCLHEAGHAIGLTHTVNFEDIMYSFQYGGDILEYFARYRRKLQGRAGIHGHSGISEADRAEVRKLYASE